MALPPPVINAGIALSLILNDDVDTVWHTIASQCPRTKDFQEIRCLTSTRKHHGEVVRAYCTIHVKTIANKKGRFIPRLTFNGFHVIWRDRAIAIKNAHDLRSYIEKVANNIPVFT